MQALVLDFDGVVSDSSREIFVVGLRTYSDLEPGSRLLAPLERLGPGSRPADYDFAADPLYRAFRPLVPLGNRAEDFGVAFLAIEHGAAIADQDSYDAFFARQDRPWCDAFHRRFYEQRAAMRAESLPAWLELQLPYPAFLAALRRHAGSVPYAIATAKDKASVRLLLDHYGVADLFGDDAILDKETGTSKRAHLETLKRRLEVPFAEITFVEDKVNHLERVAELGVRLVLADWGHNTQREHERARALGLPVASLADAEQVIFGAVPP
jgi:phosphoglycolate phosphatase-like HAD superfamily hydrolase